MIIFKPLQLRIVPQGKLGERGSWGYRFVERDTLCLPQLRNIWQRNLLMHFYRNSELISSLKIKARLLCAVFSNTFFNREILISLLN